jgi:serine/threonine protein phosphatase PrpC
MAQRPTPAAAQLRLFGDSSQVPGAREVFLQKPDISRYSAELEAEDVIVTTVGMQGWRNTMEDAHAVEFNLVPGVHFFAVFDGHGGIDSALRASDIFSDQLKKNAKFIAGRYEEALRETFLTVDEDVCRAQAQTGKNSGTTAVVVLVTSTHVFCGNVGDSRAVLCRGSKAVDLSEDHKPTLKREHDRVLSVGGQIINGRVRGMLAMTRALGDSMFKRADFPPERQVVTAVPDVTVTELVDSDVAIILACDGIWDCITSQEVCQFFIEENNEHDDWALMCEHLCEILVAPALHQFGTDNMTVLAVRFKNRGQHVGHGRVGSPLPAGRMTRSFSSSAEPNRPPSLGTPAITREDDAKR